MRMIRGVDRFSPECIEAHIANSLDFLAAALFTDREYGVKLAKKIAAAASASPRRKQDESSSNKTGRTTSKRGGLESGLDSR
jgi:hypothetical protein